jgi:hypothetical protein
VCSLAVVCQVLDVASLIEAQMGTNYPRCSTNTQVCSCHTVCCPCRGEGCCRCTVGSSARSTRRVAEGDGEDEDDGRAPSVLPCGAEVCQRGERRKRSALHISTSSMHNRFCWRARAAFACCLPLKSSPPPPPPASVAVRRRSVLEMTMIARVSTSPTSTSRRPSLVDILALGPAVLAAAARERDREEALGHVEELEEGEGSLSGSLNTMGLGDTEEGGQQTSTEPDTPGPDATQEEDDGEPPEDGAVLAKADSEMSKG